MCSSRKYPYPPQGRLTDIPTGGFQKANLLNESMTLKWNVRRGGVVQAKKPSEGGVWIFSGTTQYFIIHYCIINDTGRPFM